MTTPIRPPFLLFLLGLWAVNCHTIRKDAMLSYGAFVKGDATTFRVLAPKAARVELVLFEGPKDETGPALPMTRGSKGIWETTLPGLGYGTLYAYRLEGPDSAWHSFNPEVLVADPYTQAAVTRNTYRHVAKSLVIDQEFDWGQDQPLHLDPRDAIIYELHIRDMTRHPTARAQQPGTYQELVRLPQRAGIAHLQEMGYNAVELLPAMDFANVEVPFRDESAAVFNTWNPYARNHWGYMTTFFFAPESYYASDGTETPAAWNGSDGRAVTEFKTMVREFHKAGIAVLMDVVYNHVSNYDYHPFKYIDRAKYFRLDEKGGYRLQSGCGNDTRTEDPDLRQLILESVRFWMTEYHIDGFRFDLANLIDKQTCALIIAEARKLNPHVLIIAEPWGGGYNPEGFSDLGWSSWNDQFRNGIKGRNPQDGLGFIFGRWQGTNDQRSRQRYVMGSLRQHGGQYLQAAHSVNYLESHDDYTLGDFIRLASGLVKADQVITNPDQNAQVRGRQLALHKLAALTLLTSQGAVMIHAGQEWARSKVIAPTTAPDPDVGKLDHNSYNKDNETNWLNWNHKTLNKDLVAYYQGLIRLRKQVPEFRHSAPEDFVFLPVGKQVALAYTLRDRYAVLLNGDQHKNLSVSLPAGNWKTLVNWESAALPGTETLSGTVLVPPVSGMVLQKL